LKKSYGFTLIELLIVIALLGALAVGLLATVDPFEQLKKGTDTSRRNTTTEVYNSTIRYYSVKSLFPWTEDIDGRSLSDATMTDAPSGYLNQIISAGELKPEFIQLAGAGNLGKIYITSTEDLQLVRQNVSVCFLPESKSFANESNAKYGVNGEVSTGCKSTEAGGVACYWCIK
jgi:prepilin-type N-terminal cleavage/methylation domain-containing protein